MQHVGFARVCETCGATDGVRRCAALVCGASYCSTGCQRTDWHNGHREVCKLAQACISSRLSPATQYEWSQEDIGGLLDTIRGGSGRLVDRFRVKDNESGGVVSKLLDFVRGGDNDGDGQIDAGDDDGDSEGALLTRIKDVKQLRANARTAVESGKTDELWRDTKGGSISEVLKEMREVTRLAKERKLDVAKPLGQLGKAASSLDLVKRFAAKVTTYGFKVTFAGAKVYAGVGAEAGAVIGIPLDTLVDAIAIALDAAIFATTALESVYGIFRGFIEIHKHLEVLLTFAGGPPGVQAAVDALFDVLNSVGLGNRAKQFMGSIIEVFQRFILWGAPLIGSLFGLIPYDAAIVGRVVEFFLYPVKFFISQGWPLIMRLWNLMPGSWQELILDRQRWNGLVVSFVDLLKRLFPVDDGGTWKTRLIQKATDIGLAVARVHPLVVVGVINRERLVDRTERASERLQEAVAYSDTVISGWLDNVVVPNVDKITATVQAAMGLGFGFIYMLHAYTPDGTRRKLGLLPSLSVKTPLQTIASHLQEDNDARQRLIADSDRLQTLLLNRPTPEQQHFLMLCVYMGVPFTAMH